MRWLSVRLRVVVRLVIRVSVVGVCCFVVRRTAVEEGVVMVDVVDVFVVFASSKELEKTKSV